MAAPTGSRRLRTLGFHLVVGTSGAAASDQVPSVTTLLPAGVPLQPVGGGHTHPQITRTLDGTLVVVCAAVLDSSTPGKDCLICFRSEDGGRSWSDPVQIAPSHFKPASVTSLGGTGDFECYSGTLTTLPDGRIFVTLLSSGRQAVPALAAPPAVRGTTPAARLARTRSTPPQCRASRVVEPAPRGMAICALCSSATAACLGSGSDQPRRRPSRAWLPMRRGVRPHESARHDLSAPCEQLHCSRS